MRGDLIETFKITTGKVNYGQGLFRLSRSGVKILKDGRGERILSMSNQVETNNTRYQDL